MHQIYELGGGEVLGPFLMGVRKPANIMQRTCTVDDIVNTWISAPTDPTSLPIGTSHVTTSGPAADDLFVCDNGVANAPGAFAVGPWMDEAAGTWDKTQKISVQGAVDWPTASTASFVRATIARS